MEEVLLKTGATSEKNSNKKFKSIKIKTNEGYNWKILTLVR